MDYLLFLNRFEFDKDKLKDKINDLDSSSSFKDDNDNLLVSSKLDAKKIIVFPEVNHIAVVFTGWKDFGFKILKEDCLKLCKDKNIKDYFIEAKFYDKVAISARSLYKHINPYLKYESIIFGEDSKNIIYLELKKFDNRLRYRLSYSNSNLWNKANPLKMELSNFNVVLEEPRLVEEVSDFLRLCWIFKLPLFVLTKDQEKAEKIINKAKKITKGIEYDKFTLRYIPYLSKDFIKVGFSKHAMKNESDLLEFFKSNSDDRICLVFGNDTYGLSQDVRDDLDYCFRLTPNIKKPLKASQALSYVLGFYVSYNVITS